MDILKKRLAMAGGPFVFPCRGDSDKPLTTVRKAHYKALRATKFKSLFRLYDFRHTFGSRSAMAGVDLPTLKELMGHSDISTTMRYVHPTPKLKQEAVQKLERYNEEHVFALYEPGPWVPTEVPTVRPERDPGGVEVIEKVARLGRLERPTSGSGDQRSIQLSYRRAVWLPQVYVVRGSAQCGDIYPTQFRFYP
jgi:hypothetical protein